LTNLNASVLVVDDSTFMRMVLRRIVEAGNEMTVVGEARNGREAVELAARLKPDIITMDVEMPELDGLAAMKQILAGPPPKPIMIMVSGHTQRGTETTIKALSLGAVDFVFAPVVPAILRAKVAVFVELYRAQQELRRYRSRLEMLVEERTTALTAINRELEAFSYSVSHDLRAPLLAFDGLSKTMLEEYGDRLDKRAKDNLKRMRGASQRMTSVFDGLQTLFRLTSGEVHREQLDVTALAKDIVAETRANVPQRDVKVAIASGMTASGDRRLVRILLANLLSNAWKFTGGKPSPRIEVGTEMVDGESRIFVRDNGVGFDMIDGHRLFGAFQRLHSQSEFPGAGIGLATARRIVNRHGGRIWAEGAAGEGATFYFVI